MNKINAPKMSLALSLIALIFVCLGQYYRLYLPEYPTDALTFFGLGGALFAWTLLKTSVSHSQQTANAIVNIETPPRWWLLPISLIFAGIAWQQSSNNTFTLLGVATWWSAILILIAAFWTWQPIPIPSLIQVNREGIKWQFSWHILAVIALIALAAFFRFYRLDAVPPEMNSDHVEKLYDVYDVLTGKYPIFFERNTGREPMQFYFTVALINLFNTGLTHYSLKLSNALMGILAVIGTYLLGREIGGKRLGLLAGFFAAVSIWPVATSRIGLRYPFAPAFTSLALWSTWRALRTQHRNDWLIAGLILGLGLHGYTAFRAMPLAAITLIGLHIRVHWQDFRYRWRQWSTNITLYIAVAALVFLPLAHYMTEAPQMFWYRSLTRVAEVERPVQNNSLAILGETLSRTLGMFNWNGDEVWVCTIPNVPAIDFISGGLLILGIVYTLVQLGRKDRLPAMQLIASGFILLLPSALSLAFPRESPSVVRAGGAMPIIATLIALALWHIINQMRLNITNKIQFVLTNLLITVILVSMAATNFQQYFVQYLDNYKLSAMNTREVSEAVYNYTASMSSFDHVYLKGWPHWLDARAISLQVDQRPGWENTNVTLETQGIPTFPINDSASRLYILHPADIETLHLLRITFPTGWTQLHHSQTPGHDFIFFIVPGQDN